jgi:hypothetical protein
LIEQRYMFVVGYLMIFKNFHSTVLLHYRVSEF